MPGNGASSVWGLFVYDLGAGQLERLPLNFGNFNSTPGSPTISADGQRLAFWTSVGLVAEDVDGFPDVYYFDRDTQELVLVGAASSQGSEVFSLDPVISGNGRFVAFESDSSNLVDNDTNGNRDIFVFDTDTREIHRVNQTLQGAQLRGFSFINDISDNGQVVAFEYFAASNDADRDRPADVYIAGNEHAGATKFFNLYQGDRIQDANIGLVPDPGIVTGRLYKDTGIVNGAFDTGEEVIANHVVFIDANNNGLLDRTEQSTLTDSEGRYRLADVPAYRNQRIVASFLTGFSVSNAQVQGVAGYRVFVPAGVNVDNIDFGFVPNVSTAQSADSRIEGRVLIDSNQNGISDAGDTPMVGQTVYLDGSTLGVRDFNDPRVETDANGRYVFTGLPATVAPVRLGLANDLQQVSPSGNQFGGSTLNAIRYPLYGTEQTGGNPQAIIQGHFNNDQALDVAVVMIETNTLSIRLNDGSGGFATRSYDFNLTDIAGAISPAGIFYAPISVAAGQFDSNPLPDFAIAGNSSGNVLVIRNFNAAALSLATAYGSASLINVGEEPYEVAVGQFAGNSAQDIVVLNRGNVFVNTGQTIQILTNDGQGNFVADNPISTQGVEPISMSIGNFAGTAALDIAIVNSAISKTQMTQGSVTLFVGDGNGGLAWDGVKYPTQAGPFDSVTADLNGDSRLDLAVSNKDSNTISIFIGQANGSFRAQTATLGTGAGSLDIAAEDVDNDNDIDLVGTNVTKRDIGIFRNSGTEPNGDVRFEPRESLGLGGFTFTERVPFVMGNFDRDLLTGGKGTIDLIAIPNRSDTLFVFKNQLVQGSRRVSVSGNATDIAANIDFLIQPANLPPSFTISNAPTTLIEDAPDQVVALTQIRKGRATGPALQWSVSSNNPALIAASSVQVTAGAEQGTMHFSLAADREGSATLTIVAKDAGADGVMGTVDDATFSQSFVVQVTGVNDAPSFAMATGPSFQVSNNVGRIVSPGFIQQMSPGPGNEVASQQIQSVVVNVDRPEYFSELPSIDNSGMLSFKPKSDALGSVLMDITVVDSGNRDFGGIDRLKQSVILEIVSANSIRAEFNQAIIVNDRFVPTFRTRAGAWNVQAPDAWTNPFNNVDVNGDGVLTPQDALTAINALNSGRVFGSNSEFLSVALLTADLFRFYDCNGDGRLTPADALTVINRLNQALAAAEPEVKPDSSASDALAPLFEINSASVLSELNPDDVDLLFRGDWE